MKGEGRGGVEDIDILSMNIELRLICSSGKLRLSIVGDKSGADMHHLHTTTTTTTTTTTSE